MSTPADMVRVTDDGGGQATSQTSGQPTPTLDQKIDAAFAPPAQDLQPGTAPAVQPAQAMPQAPEGVTAQQPASVEPVPAVDAPPAIPTPESYLAPIFELAKLPLNEAAPQAAEQMRNFATYDPAAFGVLLNGMYQAASNTYRQWALDDMGIKQEDVGKFADYLARGGGELTAPMYYPPFPLPDADPNSTDYGLVTLPGIGAIDTKDAFGKRFYDNEKFKYETEASNAKAGYEKQQADARTVEQGRVAAEAEEQRQIAERSDTFMKNTVQAIDSQVAKILPQLAPEDAWKVRAAKAYAFAHVQDVLADPNSEAAKLIKEAAPYVAQGAGRTAEFQQKVNNILVKAALAEAERFNLEILRGNQAQRALAATAPVLPPGTTVITGAPIPSDQRPTNRKEWEQQGIDRVGAALENEFRQRT